MKQALFELWREVFEGVSPESPGTWFVQGSEAILNSLMAIGATRASVRLPGQRASIGAHARHLCYYLHLFNANARGESVDADWEGSWAVQQFNEVEWSALIQEIRGEYHEAARHYESGAGQADADAETYAVANLAHATFHLGAIRALMPIVGA